MKTALLGMAVGITLWLGLPLISQARPVYVCERADGTLTVTNFPAGVAGDPEARTRAIDRTRQKGLLPEAAQCWNADDSTLPPRYRPDPRDAAAQLPQRHQWRRGAGSVVILNPAIKSPHGAAFRRALPTVLPPGRQAVVTRDPQGAAFLQALTRQDWPLAKALLAELATGPPPPVFTPPEIVAIRALGADYEIDL